jgi:hypothetical protein
LDWTPGGTLPEEDWQLPAYCFKGEEEEDEQVQLPEQRQKVRLSMA